MPSLSVTRIHAAPMRSRYSWAWSRTSARLRLVNRRWRNCGICPLAALTTPTVRVRAARKFSAAWRVLSRPRWIAASAVRLACIDVTPNVTPSTATTSSAEDRKILLVTLTAFVRGIVAAVLVLVRRPPVAASVEGDRDVGHRRRAGPHGDFLHDLERAALVPHVQPVASRRNAGEGEQAVTRGLREEAPRHHVHVRHHAGVHVAEHRCQHSQPAHRISQVAVA